LRRRAAAAGGIAIAIAIDVERYRANAMLGVFIVFFYTFESRLGFMVSCSL
jgi:hypothetical protein